MGFQGGSTCKNRYRRWPQVVIILLAAALGVATQALAQVFTEFPIPTANSQPYVITVGPDRALWFTERGLPDVPGVENIGRITTTGVITEFLPPSTKGDPNSITTRADGALWFTENGTNQIGRITTAGVITEFPIPTPSSR